MHLTQAIKTGKNNKNFHLLDFLCFKSAKIKNQVLYHILQPYHYYNALKNNQPTYPHQLQLIQEINGLISKYNEELAKRQDKQKKLDKINKNKCFSVT